MGATSTSPTTRATPAARGRLWGSPCHRGVAPPGGASPTATDDVGWTPLHEAAWRVTPLWWVLLQGRRYQRHRLRGNTPLHVASRKGHTSLVEVMLANDAYVNFIDATVYCRLKKKLNFETHLRELFIFFNFSFRKKPFDFSAIHIISHQQRKANET